MKIISDLHVHSRYARATSTSLNLQNLEKYARIKGVNLLGTGDFTHPKWFQEVKQELKEDENGILWSKTNFPFVWQTEISLIYTQDGKGRRVHHVILAPSTEVVTQIREALGKKGRLDYDGRPIFGINSIELVDMLMSISDKCLIIPAHLWTPFFGAMGSMSGFDSVQDCFKEKSKYVYAIETGLSSDPAMNWRISSLDNFALLSFSDLHSYWPWRIGRESTVFDIEMGYDNLFKAIKTKNGLIETIEVDPNYGKYHFTGHRSCNVCLSPKESIALNDTCPKCRRKLTVGVLQRVEKLADREEGFIPKNAVPFKTLIPLSEIIAEVSKKGIATKEVWKIYYDLINRFGSEFNVLLEADSGELKKTANENLANAIILNREGKVKVKPGYDGEYGKPVFGGNSNHAEETKMERIKGNNQKGLGDYF